MTSCFIENLQRVILVCSSFMRVEVLDGDLELTSFKQHCSIVSFNGMVSRTALIFTKQEGMNSFVMYAVG